MLHARRQSTAELQQQHVDRLNRHTIHTTSAGMAHANGPTARATVNSTSWWWGQEQRVVLNFVDADTTQKAMGATSAQIDFVCVICTSNSSTAAVASLSLPLSVCVSLFKGTSQRYCYESLERVIGINHKYWNHGKIKGTKAPLLLSTSEMALSLPEGL